VTDNPNLIERLLEEARRDKRYRHHIDTCKLLTEAAQTIAALRAEYGKLKEHFDTACYRAEAAEARVKDLEHYEELWLGIGVKQ